MCGIAGIIRFDDQRVSSERLDAMVQSLSHRGPDGSGIKVWDRMGIGHRRLSIIDLETGSQPMSNEDGSVWITFNGEIYNFRELRSLLEKKGHRFVSRSDTEAIIHAYEEWGFECVAKLRGMFAFGIADLRANHLFLARDHFGIKPLCYRKEGEFAAFASELHALKFEGPRLLGDMNALDPFLRYQYIPAPQTIYKNVFKLPAAHYLVIGIDGKTRGPVRYWDVPIRSGSKQISEGEWIEKTERVIGESVRSHLVSDVPFGVFLSGGLDSSLVAWKMSQSLKQSVQAFSIGFKEQSFSELPYAESAAQQLGLEWRSKSVEEQSLALLPELIAQCGEPFGDDSIIPCWHLAKFAREHVPMVLSGDGGDEGFGGYDFYRDWILDRASPRFVRHCAQLHIRSAWKALRDIVRFQIGGGLGTEWKERMGFIPLSIRERLWKAEYRALVDHPCRAVDNALLKKIPKTSINLPRYMDYRFYLPDDVLMKVDISSMCHGLEVRTPLIDLNVVTHAWEMPDSMLARFQGQLFQGKYALRKVMAGQFGNEFVNRKKQGFALPRSEWLKPGEAGWKIVKEEINNAEERLCDWFSWKEIEDLLANPEKNENGNALWLIYVLSVWLNRNPEVSFQ